MAYWDDCFDVRSRRLDTDAANILLTDGDREDKSSLHNKIHAASAYYFQRQ